MYTCLYGCFDRLATHGRAVSRLLFGDGGTYLLSDAQVHQDDFKSASTVEDVYAERNDHLLSQLDGLP